MYNDNFCNRQINIINTFRELWEQHVLWTRAFIKSTILGTGDQPYAAARLMRNPSDFANILKLYYGKDNAVQFQKLFEEHLTIAASLVGNAKSGNSIAAAEDERRWYQNADQIALFLSELNPFWSMQEWQRMMYEHLRMTKQEAVYFLTQQYQESVNLFDAIQNEALKMADYMAQGVIRQF